MICRRLCRSILLRRSSGIKRRHHGLSNCAFLRKPWAAGTPAGPSCPSQTPVASFVLGERGPTEWVRYAATDETHARRCHGRPTSDHAVPTSRQVPSGDYDRPGRRRSRRSLSNETAAPFRGHSHGDRRDVGRSSCEGILWPARQPVRQGGVMPCTVLWGGCYSGQQGGQEHRHLLPRRVPS